MFVFYYVVSDWKLFFSTGVLKFTNKFGVYLS